MSSKKPKPRRRSDRCQAYTWVITITTEHAELLERIVETEYSSFAECRTFRGMALTAFNQGLRAIRSGLALGERKADPDSPVFAKLPEGFKPGLRRLTLTEEAVAVAEFMTGIFPSCGQAKKFQEAAEGIMNLGIAVVEGLLIRHKNAERREFPQERETEGRRTGDRRQGQITKEEYCRIHGIDPIPPGDPGEPWPAPSKEPKPRWPKQVDPKPTPTSDDLPELFGE